MHHIDLTTITLKKGAHDDRADGLCVMEAVAYFAGEEHSDAPQCVSPVLIRFGQRLNDLLPDDKRQQLVSLIPQLPGTRGDGLDGQRGYLALDWLVRTYTPAWLDLAGLTAQAQALRDLRPIADLATAQAAGPVVRAGGVKARAAWAAAWAAAGEAAWAAARDVAGEAAWDAAGDAAGEAARAAARDVAGEAAWDAAGDAARAAARDVAGEAAGEAAGDAAGEAAWAAAGEAAWEAAWAAAGEAAWDAAGDAAGEAARAALKPTVDQLQAAAITLFTTMIRPEES